VIGDEVPQYDPENEFPLEGCMSGRLAMNSPWELSRIDREIYKDFSCDSINREELLIEYADWIQD
jgi:hypothetical protein